MLRLKCCINKTKKEECFNIVEKNDGMLISFMPETEEKEENGDYQTIVMYFEDLNNANSFIYNCYNRFGLYFFIKELVDVSLRHDY